MKYLKRMVSLFLAIGLITLSVNSTAQNMTPKDGTIVHEDAPRQCLVVVVEPESKTLKKAWEDYLNDHYDIKLKGIGFLSNKDLLSAEEVNIAPISSKTLDFYTHIIEAKNGSEMKVFAAHGYDLYINQQDTPAEYAAMKEILIAFLKDYLPKYQQEMVENKEDAVKELMEEKEDIKENIVDNTNEIKELEEEIKELKAKLNSNNTKLEDAEKALKEQKAKMKATKKELKKM